MTGVAVLAPRLSAPPPTLSARPWTCNGTVSNRDTSGAIRVPARQACHLVGVNQIGPLTVGDGASLTLDHSAVTGAVTARNSRDVELRDSTVTDMLTLMDPRRANVVGNTIGGTTVSAKRGRLVLTRNVISGDLLVRGGQDNLSCPRNVVKFRLDWPCSR